MTTLTRDGITVPLLLVLAPGQHRSLRDRPLPAGVPAHGRRPERERHGHPLTLTMFLLGFAAGQLVFGPLSDRIGRRGPLQRPRRSALIGPPRP